MSPDTGWGGRDFALWTIVKLVVAAIVVFLIAGLAIPNLVNAHDTARLVLAIALAFAIPAVIVWTIVSIRRSYRRLHRTGTHLMKVDE